MRIWCFICVSLLGQIGLANANVDPIAVLYSDWQNSSVFNTQSLDKSMLKSFIKRAQTLNQLHPNDPQMLALSGLIKAFYASQSSSIEGLKVAKQARDDLQQALRLEPNILADVTYAELGYLYHNTPGWPFSFGSQLMAEKLLKKAIELDPDGLTSNLRLGEYCFDQKNYLEAKNHLQLAINIAAENKQVAFVEFQILQAKQMLAKIKS